MMSSLDEWQGIDGGKGKSGTGTLFWGGEDKFIC